MSIVSELVEVLGSQVTEALCAKFGGQELYVPRQIPTDHSLVRELGGDAAGLLAQFYGGIRLSIPKGNHRRQRAIELLAEVKAGRLSLNEVASKTGYTVRHLYSLRAMS